MIIAIVEDLHRCNSYFAEFSFSATSLSLSLSFARYFAQIYQHADTHTHTLPFYAMYIIYG